MRLTTGVNLGLGLGALAAASALASTRVHTAELAAGVFESAEAAAVAAAHEFAARSARDDREYMGGLFERSGAAAEFAFSAAAGEIGRDDISVRIVVPRGWRLVAIWHTHGAPHRSREYFSEVDTRLVERLGLPLYLAAPSGALRVFAPGGPRLSARESLALKLGARRGYARGRLVAARVTSRGDA